jgi:diguanylate cyclase (GGDEF)-like protein
VTGLRHRRLAVQLALTVLLGLLVTGAAILVVARSVVLHTEESEAATHAQLVSSVALAPALRTEDFSHLGSRRRRELDRLFRENGLTGALYGIDGTAVYANDGKRVGSWTPASQFVMTAAAHERIELKRIGATLEIAVPLRLERAGPVGVVLLSTEYAALARSAAHIYLPIAAALELLVALLFVALIPTVRRAVTETRRHVQDAESYALRDGLTGLPNRRLFDDHVELAVAQAERSGATPAVMLIDLDRFKEINDTLGHAAGDALLRETAIRLVEALRDGDTVARIGGDEFAVVLPDAPVIGIHETARRLQYAIETPLEHEGVTLAVGASIGVALAPEHGRAVGTLLRHADLAMYQAKRAGLGHVVFEPGASQRDTAADSLADDLKQALDRGEIVLHYQPTIALDSLEVSGVEALLRWVHPEQGVLPAERFMPLVGRAGIRQRLHDFALREAVRQAGAWRQAGLDLSVAVNLDARTLLDPDLPRRLERLLAEHGVDPQQIEAEISEAALLGDADRVRAGAIELAALGVVLAVDGFGADQTSLNSLAYLPIEKLKIDRTLLVRALESPRDRIVLAGVIELAHKLGLRAVVAGVESAEALELAREVGCDFGQGYHLGAPTTAPSAERLLGVAA